jgi:glutaredoxin 3
LAKVEIYTTPYCPYCISAKSLLHDKGIEFEEIDVSGDPRLRAKMVERAGGRRTVPEIFIDGRIIGGYDELYTLEMEGGLEALLTEPE